MDLVCSGFTISGHHHYNGCRRLTAGKAQYNLGGIVGPIWLEEEA